MVQGVPPQPGDQLGEYVIDSRVGKGRTGSVYLGKVADRLNEEVAIKYPSGGREISILHALQGCLGVPLVHSSGILDEEMWVAMELLGPTLLVVLRTLWLCTSSEQRWQGACIIGRLLLRRVLAIHARGYVHGDIKPENVVIGKRPNGAGELSWPFLVDYGLARELTDDSPVDGHIGTIEFSSINSMSGGRRVRQDDLEALGWMLLYAMVGDLPWFEWIHEVDWNDKPARSDLVKRVQKAKQDLLGEGQDSVESKYKQLPVALPAFLRLCCSSAGETRKPDYEMLARLLGCWGIEGDEDEMDDLLHFHRFFAGGNGALPEPHTSMNKYFVVATWNKWNFEEMSPHSVLPDVHCLEVLLPKDGGEFQILRNKQWSEVFHPMSKSATPDSAVVGPERDGHGLNWRITSKAGTVVEIAFHCAPDHKASLRRVTWKELRQENLALTSPAFWYTKYFLVGTWDNWQRKKEMTWTGKCFTICVQMGHKLWESFQILEDGDWNKKLHPSVRRANPHEPHELQGPEKHGHGRNWTIGAHPLDRAAFGAQYVIRLFVIQAQVKNVDWVRLS